MITLIDDLAAFGRPISEFKLSEDGPTRKYEPIMPGFLQALSLVQAAYPSLLFVKKHYNYNSAPPKPPEFYTTVDFTSAILAYYPDENEAAGQFQIVLHGRHDIRFEFQGRFVNLEHNRSRLSSIANLAERVIDEDWLRKKTQKELYLDLRNEIIRVANKELAPLSSEFANIAASASREWQRYVLGQGPSPALVKLLNTIPAIFERRDEAVRLAVDANSAAAARYKVEEIPLERILNGLASYDDLRLLSSAKNPSQSSQ